LLLGVGAALAQRFLEGGDLAEPGAVFGSDQPGYGVAGHFLDPWELCGVDAQEPASGAGVLVDAWRPVGTMAVAERDLAHEVAGRIWVQQFGSFQPSLTAWSVRC
jgi:hypothetical protein